MISKEKLEVFNMINFNEDSVRKIFLLKSKGKTGVAIGLEMGCSDSHVSQILLRRIHSDVKIDERILEKLKTIHSTRKSPIKRQTSVAPPTPLHEAIASYTAACFKLKEAKEVCVEAGVCGDTLELLRESVKTGQ